MWTATAISSAGQAWWVDPTCQLWTVRKFIQPFFILQGLDWHKISRICTLRCNSKVCFLFSLHFFDHCPRIFEHTNRHGTGNSCSRLSVITTSTTAAPAQAVTADSFGTRTTVVIECKIALTPTLDLGTGGVLSVDVDASAKMDVICPDTTLYDIGPRDDRLCPVPKGGARYELGQCRSAKTQPMTGTGNAQFFNAFGRVLA